MKGTSLNGWIKLCCVNVCNDLKDALLAMIAETDFKTLMDDALPIDDLLSYYYRLQDNGDSLKPA